MFLYNRLGRGRYLTIGTLFHKAIEIGYDIFNDHSFNLSMTYDVSLEYPEFRFSISLFNFLFEFSVCDARCFQGLDVEFESFEAEESDTLSEEEIDESYIFESSSSAETSKEEAISSEIKSSSVKPKVKKLPPPLPANNRVAKEVRHEIAEYGSVALMKWVGTENGGTIHIDGSESLKIGSTVIVRSPEGQTYFLGLRCDEDGWFVNHPTSSSIIDVIFDSDRKLWVIDDPF